MGTGSDWYGNEALLLRALEVSGWSPPIEPSIPGFADWHELRRGGQGVVFSATQLSTRRRVAVKMLMGGPIASRAQLRRFDREIELIAGFQHPHIVRLYDRGVTDQGLPYYVMELIDGCSLEQHLGLRLPDGESRSGIAGGTPLDHPPTAAAALPPIRDTIGLLAKVCEAVAYAHQRGVVHRDLKPGNVLVDRMGEPHVLDFGLGRNVFTRGAGASATMSQTGDFFGTLPWACPEQTEGTPAHIDARSDVYSLGVVLFQALTGSLPYPVSTLREALENIRDVDPPPPSSLRRGLGGELDAVVLKCLAKEPKRRYADAAELARDLNAYLAGEPVAARPDSAVHRLSKQLRRHRRSLIVVAALLVGGTIALSSMLYAWRYRGSATAAPAAPVGPENVVDELGRCRATELFRLQPSDCAAKDGFGYSAAIDGDTAVVGSRWDDDLGPSAGSAYLYEFDGANWVQRQKLLASDGGTRSHFGFSAAIDGDTVVVGMAGTPENQAAYVFVRDGADWIEQAKLTTADPLPIVGFGSSVAIRGDTIAVAPYFGGTGDERLAYVFERDDAGTPDDLTDDRWHETARLVAPDRPARSFANQGVALTDERLVVGATASLESDAGAYVFRREPGRPTEWALETRLLPTNGRPGDSFGYAVAADGNLIAVCAWTDDAVAYQAGGIYVFRFDGATWMQEDKLLPWDGDERERFGFALALQGGIIVVGANGDSHAGDLCGAAYVFEHDGQSWQGRARLVATDAEPIASFGASVAFDGRHALIGAHHGCADLGAAYIFGGLSDCDQTGQLDVCEIAAQQAADRNHDGRPDRCEPFGRRVSRNTTAAGDAVFLGAPDGLTGILGTGTVEIDFDPWRIIDGAGPDFNVYEFKTGYPGFGLIDVQVSRDGKTFVSVKTSELPGVSIPGDGVRTVNPLTRRAYDLAAAGFTTARYVRVVGLHAKTTEGGDFDLDALGAIHFTPHPDAADPPGAP